MPVPTGTPLRDGFSTIIGFSYDSTIDLVEKEVTPPSAEGGDPIDITTMRNQKYVTRAPQALVDTGQATIRCAYDPNHNNRIRAMVNKNQILTFTYPQGQPDAFWGFLTSWKPDPLVRGQQPMGTAVFTCSNIDNTGAEVAPSLGTSTTSTTSTTS